MYKRNQSLRGFNRGCERFSYGLSGYIVFVRKWSLVCWRCMVLDDLPRIL